MKIIRRYGASIWLAFLGVGFFIHNALYVSKSRQYPQWDEHHYVGLSRAFYDIIKHPTVDMWQQILKVSDYRQPLYPLITAFILQITGPSLSYTVSLMVNGLFFIITLYALYGIVRRFGDKTSALLTSIIYAGMGFPLFYLHFAYSETATAMWVTLSVLFLLKSEGFSKRSMSIVAAFAFVGGFLTRWVAPIFIIGIIVWEFFIIIGKWRLESRKQRMTRLVNALLFIGISTVLSLLLYYLPNFQPFTAYTFRNSANSREWVSLYKGIEYANPMSAKTLVYYMNTISQNTIYYFILFIAGIVYSVIHWKKYGGLLLNFIIPYGVFSILFLWKDDRFIVPLYPAVAVLSDLALLELKKGWKRIFVSFLIICMSVASYFGCMWGIGPLGNRGLTDIVLPPFIHHPRRIYLTSMVWPPVKEYINADAIIQLIRANKDKGQSTIALLVNHEQLANALFSIEQYNTFGEFRLFTTSQMSNKTIIDSDFVIARKNITESDGYPTSCFHFIQSKYPQVYAFIGDVVVPSDESIVSVYKKLLSITPHMLESPGSICLLEKSI